VPGHRGLRLAEDALQVADAQRPPYEQVDQAQPGAIGQGTEELRRQGHSRGVGVTSQYTARDARRSVPPSRFRGHAVGLPALHAITSPSNALTK